MGLGFGVFDPEAARQMVSCLVLLAGEFPGAILCGQRSEAGQ